MRNIPRARRPVMALAAPAIIATAGLLSACSSAHSGSPVAQQSPRASQTAVSQQTPVSQPTPPSPAPAPQSQPRQGANHLDPASFSMVTVNFRESDELGINLSKQVRSPAVIARLTRIVNSLPAANPASMSCPAATFRYRMSFTGIGSQPDITVTTRSCPVDRFSVGGNLQGPLWDRKGAVAAEVKRLMHLKISHSALSTGTLPPVPPVPPIPPVPPVPSIPSM